MVGQLKAAALLLAGGESRRMGIDKALIEFGGEPLIGRISRRLSAWFAEVLVITNHPERYAFLGLPTVSDRTPGLGPLGGLEAGLSACHHEHAFLCATDMPFLHEGLVRHLVGLAPGYQVVVPQVGGAYEPLHAVYSRSCLPPIRQRLAARDLPVIGLYDEVCIRMVTCQALAAFGDAKRLFFNCNTPHDILQARAWERET